MFKKEPDRPAIPAGAGILRDFRPAPRSWEEESREADAKLKREAFAGPRPAADLTGPALGAALTPLPLPVDPADELAQAAAARDLLNRLAAEGKIALGLYDADGKKRNIEGDLLLWRPVTRTVTDWEPLP